MASFASPMLEVADMIVEAGGTTLDLCYQCGTCSGTCPWNRVREFRVRDIITRAQVGLEGYEGEALWLCATCNACVDRCPRGVEIVDLVRTIRGILVETGSFPKTLRSVFGSVQSNGNPWSGEPAVRKAIAAGLDAPAWDPSMDYAYFACCSQAYDPRNARVGQATLNVLKAAGVSFGHLGGAESCCGDAVRKAGSESLFDRLASDNAGLFAARGVRKVLVPSPHCLNSFKKDYDGHGGPYAVTHVVEVLAAALRDGRLALTTPVPARAIWHDPCYLGRWNRIYDAPREVLRQVPGVELLEFHRNREESVCCGGGGGRLWMETPVEERFAVQKLREAAARGATHVVTACPYCISMFEDAKTALGLDIAVADVTEIVAQAL